MQSYLFTSCHQVQQNYTQLLFLISSHPQFKSKINQFLPLFPYRLSQDSIIKMGTLIYAVLLPGYPRSIQRKLAVELFHTLQIKNDQVTYTHLTEYLLKICSDLVENIDVRSAIGVLDMLLERIIDCYVIDAEDPNYKVKLQTSIKLQIFDPETIITDSQMLEKFHRKAGQLTYYEEKVIFQEPKQLKPSHIKIKKLKEKVEEIIPLGYILEEFCFDYINNNFEAKNSYRVKGNKAVSIPGKIDYWVTLNNAAGNTLRDNVVNQEIYQSSSVLTLAHMPQQIHPAAGKNISTFRLNTAFSMSNYYQKLKENTGSSEVKHKYFNILSQYYDRDQFNIDQIALTKEKLVIRRKEHLLGISGKETIKKQQKDYDLEMKQLPIKINKNKKQFMNDTRLQENIKELSRSLRMVLQEGKNLHALLEKNLSNQSQLPSDPINPFKEDVINLAKIDPMQIFIVGRAKSGKSTLAQLIAKNYNLVYISIQSVIDKVIERSKNFKQNPPEPDEDGNIKDGLVKIQECIISDLEEGKAVQEEDILDLINNQLRKQETHSKGYILDLPIQYDSFWFQSLIENKIMTPKIGCRFFNRIVQIDQSEEQWAYFLNGLMIRQQDLSVSSIFDRYLQKKPKPPPQEGEQQQPQPDDGQKPPPLIEANLLQIKWEQFALPLIQHLSLQIHPLNFLKVKNSFQNLQECFENLKPYLYKIPCAKKIEGNEKQLLTIGLQQQKIARKWSPWGLVDCVQLSRQKVVIGKFQNAAEYAGRVFVFQNQQNLNSFLIYPRKFVNQFPKLPKKTNICITGPRKSGKKTIAKILSETYGLKIIDLEDILKKVLKKQKENETHVPSNPDKASQAVHLSETEFKQFYKGGPLNAKDVLPIILFQLGISLQKKPPGWGIQKTDEQGGQEVLEEKKPAPKKNKKKDKNQEQRPKTPPLEDIALKDIIPKINHKKKLDEIKGFILIGFPNNQDQLNALKAFNIPIDKLILLSDNSEQNPFKTLSKRLTQLELQQVTNYLTNFASVKQALGQENVKELTNLQLSPEELINKIRQFIDPFYPKPDDDSLNRVCADKQQQGDPIPLGFCGDYCPVTLADGWLIKGKQQFQSGFQGKRYKFVSQNQMTLFKENPTRYINKNNLTISPRIMFMGIRGVGLRTQLLKINKNYKIPIINFKESLLQQLENEKTKRKSQRYYNKGFKIPQYDEDGKIVEDPELNEQAAEFDRAAVEVEVVKRMFDGIGDIFINSNFYDVEEDLVATPLVDLLAQARRLPQVVFMLKSNEPKWLQRNLNRKEIEQQLEQIKQKRRQQKRKERQEARLKAEQNGQQYQEPAQQEQEDPQIPKIQDLIAQKEQSLKAQREGDSAKLEQLTEAFKLWNVDVIEITCEREQKHVYDRINHCLNPYMNDRINKWEQNDMLPIERHRTPDFINNYIALESRFGQLNPFTLIKPVLGLPLIYNDRIYYLKDQEQLERVMRNPTILNQNQGVPNDIVVNSTVSIIGHTKTGKTTLAANLCKKMGLIHIEIEKLVEQFCVEHKDKQVIDIIKHLQSGKALTDQMLVDLIQKRLTLSDCQQNGWVLDGFPTNRNQCDLLCKKGLLPANVFSLKLTQLDLKKRVIQKIKGQSIPEYSYDLQVVHQRIEKNSKNLLEVQVYFTTRLNSLEMLDAKVSKWGLFQIVQKCIQKKIKGRKGLIRSLITHSATPASDIGLHYNCILNYLSEFSNFNPISYKIKREYIKLCPKHHSNIALYQKKIYLFSNEGEMNDFIKNPENYKKKGASFSPPQTVLEDITDIISQLQNKGFCPVQLGRKKLSKGNYSYIFKYHGKYYSLSSPSNMKLFIKNPTLFEMNKIPDKLPVQFEKKSDLKKIAKKNDCTAFLEHHLSNILMKCLAQLGYRRPKYPTLGSKQSALKFLAINLKATNPNKDDEYRQKYVQKLNDFIKYCNYSQEIREELDRKQKGPWESYDQQNLLKLSEEYNDFLGQLNASDKNQYFSQFIR